MPTYTVTDPQTGKRVKLTGDSPPTEAELVQVFARLSPATEPARTPGRPQGPATIGEVVGDVVVGGLKGITNTVTGLGELVHHIPGVSATVDRMYGRPGISDAAFQEADRITRPTNTAQKVGFYGEQIGEFFIPVGAAAGKVRAGAEIGKSALLTGAQGGSKRDVALDAALTAVLPGGGALTKAADWVGTKAEPLVRAAIKPTVASLRKITGAGGMDAKATALVRFIIDHKLTTPEQARTLFQTAEHELQRVLSLKNAPTDAAVRADRYIEALIKSASKQGLGADDVELLRKAADDLVKGPMGKTVAGPAGTARVLRDEVPAAEALGSARSSSRWTTRKSWGEQKGATMEAAKAVEKAQRDAVKAAVPEARELLATEGKALQAEDVLERMAVRTGNRDAASLPAHVIAAGEIASGNVPVLAFAANWLRNNQLKAGIWADSLQKAITKGNAPLVADILKRLGVGSASQEMRTPATVQ